MINCPHCGEPIDQALNLKPNYVRSEYIGEWPPEERCDYGSCDHVQSHLGPHRCGACGRPCDDPELSCEVHRSGWPSNYSGSRKAFREVR